MPFETIETETKFNRPVQAGISYMRGTRKLKGGGIKKDSRPQLRISIPTTVAGVNRKKHFVLQLGKGADAGKARIVGQNARNKASIEPKDLMKCVIFNFGFVPMLGDDSAALEHVPVRKIDDDQFEIDLPPWFKPETQSNAKGARAA